MDDKSLVPRGSTELVRRTEGLAKRGLQLIDEIHQIEATLNEYEISPLLNKLNKVKGSIGDIPEEFLNSPIANPHDVTSFDLKNFLEAFDLVSIRHDYVLDYVYAYNYQGGEPFIYAREINELPLSSPDEYYEKFSIPRQVYLLGEEPTYKDSLPYLKYLQFENSPIGCFQFALFCMTVRRFYLFWHSNYNSRNYLLRKERLDQFIQDRAGGISPSETEQLNSAMTNPKIKIVGKSSQVTLLNFERNRGYSYLHVYLTHPNIFERLEDEIIIKSHTQLFW